MSLYTPTQQIIDQADVDFSQNNPVSNTLYTVWDTTRNVRIISINAKITWAVTQPTPLEVLITIDGHTRIATVVNPVSGTNYEAIIFAADTNMTLGTGTNTSYRAFLLEGKSVKVQIRIIWATTQPTPLVCKLKFAKRA